MKKRLRLVLVVLGMITTIEAQRTALRSMGEMDIVDEVVVSKPSKKKDMMCTSSESPKKYKERERKEDRSNRVEPEEGHWCVFNNITPDKEDRTKKLYADLAVGLLNIRCQI